MNLHLPGGPGIRVDSHLMPGYAIPPFYDSLIAKVIAWAPDREQAIRRMRRALGEMTVEGVKTTIPFLLQFLESERFQQGEFCRGQPERAKVSLKAQKFKVQIKSK